MNNPRVVAVLPKKNQTWENTPMQRPHEPLDRDTRHTLMRMFLEAIALGDALGATTEFLSVGQAIDRTLALREQGFPFVPVGGGWLNLPAGAHTDDTDMALAIAEAFVDTGDVFDPGSVAKRWRAWLGSHPPDVGMLTRQALTGPLPPQDLYARSRHLFLQSPQRSPNGALMRNAIICAMAPNLPSAFEWSLKQGILTHYHPLSVLCCAVQVWLIWETFEERWPFDAHSDWLSVWHRDWTGWLLACTDPDVNTWRATVDEGNHLDMAMHTLCEADFDLITFDPFTAITSAAQGWVLASLQVSIWAMQWCRRPESDLPAIADTTASAVTQVFMHRGHDTIGWIPLIGRDADTYVAIAAPMIAAALGIPFPTERTKHLRINPIRFLERND